MKKNLIISLKLTLVMIILCAVLYPLLVAAVGKATPGGGKGKTVLVNEKIVGYENVGQKFTDDKYFNGRPSAVDYNAGGSGGSNKGPTNPDYLQVVKDRIDSFLIHNPGIQKEEIPADLVTAAAFVQVKRIAAVRGIAEDKVKTLVEQQIEKKVLGPSVINVLKLNIALDNLK